MLSCLTKTVFFLFIPHTCLQIGVIILECTITHITVYATQMAIANNSKLADVVQQFKSSLTVFEVSYFCNQIELSQLK